MPYMRQSWYVMKSMAIDARDDAVHRAHLVRAAGAQGLDGRESGGAQSGCYRRHGGCRLRRRRAERRRGLCGLRERRRAAAQAGDKEHCVVAHEDLHRLLRQVRDQDLMLLRSELHVVRAL